MGSESTSRGSGGPTGPWRVTVIPGLAAASSGPRGGGAPAAELVTEILDPVTAGDLAGQP